MDINYPKVESEDMLRLGFDNTYKLIKSQKGCPQCDAVKYFNSNLMRIGDYYDGISIACERILRYSHECGSKTY